MVLGDTPSLSAVPFCPSVRRSARSRRALCARSFRSLLSFSAGALAPPQRGFPSFLTYLQPDREPTHTSHGGWRTELVGPGVLNSSPFDPGRCSPARNSVGVVQRVKTWLSEEGFPGRDPRRKHGQTACGDRAGGPRPGRMLVGLADLIISSPVLEPGLPSALRSSLSGSLRQWLN